MTEHRLRNPELASILEAEAQARRVVEAAEAEARRIEAEARRRANERLEAARACLADRRDADRRGVFEGAEGELERIRAEARCDRERVAAAGARRREAAVNAVLALLLGEEQ